MDYSENEKLAVLAKNGDEKALEKLVNINGGLIKSIALRFSGRKYDVEDLIQLGTIGFIKAVRCFDESYGVLLSTYAVPLIMGEIRRFIRDDGIVKVSREAKRNYAILCRKKEKFSEEFGYDPPISHLAKMCGISFEDAVYALNSGNAVLSLDGGEEDGETPLYKVVGNDNTDSIVEKIALTDAIKSLPDIWRKIIALRYSKGLSQSQTASVLGLTQVKISREEKKIYEALREKLA